jgi:hypothetical protein
MHQGVRVRRGQGIRQIHPVSSREGGPYTMGFIFCGNYGGTE